MRLIRRAVPGLSLVLILGSFTLAFSQQPSPTPTPTPTLGLEQGYQEFDTPNFKIKLVKSSQTIAALQPKSAPGFDFTPADRLERRASDGFHHLGDLTFRLRTNNGAWRDFSTATKRTAVNALSVFKGPRSNDLNWGVGRQRRTEVR